MTHDKIKAAARKRMAQTGEPYQLARLEVIKERKEAQYQVPYRDRSATERRLAAIGGVSEAERRLMTMASGALEAQRRLAAIGDVS